MLYSKVIRRHVLNSTSQKIINGKCIFVAINKIRLIAQGFSLVV